METYTYCRNPRCRVETASPLGVCASCRLAGTWGAGVAFLVGALLKLVGWL